MAGTDAGGPNDANADALDSIDEKPDNSGDSGGLLSSVLSRGDRDDAGAVEAADEDAGGGLFGRVRDALGSEDTTPSRAELVDGANVLFIDPAAKRKSLYEYDLVLITAPAYPEPIVLKNDVPIEIPEGSVLCTASSTTMINYGGKRLLAKANILVPPDRADEVDPDYREDVPEAVVGKTIPQRGVQDKDFYQLVLNGCAASSE